MLELLLYNYPIERTVYLTLYLKLTLQADIRWPEKQDNCSAQSSQTSWNANAAIGAMAGSLRAVNIMGMTSLKIFGCPFNQLPSEPIETQEDTVTILYVKHWV